MKKVLFILLTFYCTSAFSQTQHFTVGLNYPILLGNNFITKSYIGIVDAEMKYYPYKIKNLKLGISTDVGLLTTTNTYISRFIDYNPDVAPVNALFIKPGLTAEMEFGKLVPYAGAGYSFFNYISQNWSGSDDGLNMNLGLKYNLFQRFFLNVDLDYTRFRLKGESIDIPYNKNSYLLKAGIGYCF
jgi:Outer membrane protein W